MLTEKIVYIIPGFRHTPDTKAYKEIAKMLKKEGYRPILISIPWKNTTISENTKYFLKRYKQIKTRRKYILGFSFGAMIAFLASTKVSASGLILCSLSPYFQEDLSKTSNSVRYQDFQKLHFATLAKKIKAKKVSMLYGTKEEKSLKKRVTAGFRQISSPEKYLIPIRATAHDIGDPRYLHTIHKLAKEMN